MDLGLEMSLRDRISGMFRRQPKIIPFDPLSKQPEGVICQACRERVTIYRRYPKGEMLCVPCAIKRGR